MTSSFQRSTANSSAVRLSGSRMTFLSWSSEFSVGVPSIDREHMELMDLVNQIHDKLCACAPETDLRISFLRLSTHVLRHFWNEEKLFVGTSYPRAAAHAHKHASLLAALEAFQRRLTPMGQSFALEEQLDFLRHWLMDHIATEDIWLGAYLTRDETPPSS